MLEKNSELSITMRFILTVLIDRGVQIVFVFPFEVQAYIDLKIRFIDKIRCNILKLSKIEKVFNNNLNLYKTLCFMAIVLQNTSSHVFFKMFRFSMCNKLIFGIIF